MLVLVLPVRERMGHCPAVPPPSPPPAAALARCRAWLLFAQPAGCCVVSRWGTERPTCPNPSRWPCCRCVYA